MRNTVVMSVLVMGLLACGDGPPRPPPPGFCPERPAAVEPGRPGQVPLRVRSPERLEAWRARVGLARTSSSAGARAPERLEAGSARVGLARTSSSVGARAPERLEAGSARAGLARTSSSVGARAPERLEAGSARAGLARGWSSGSPETWRAGEGRARALSVEAPEHFASWRTHAELSRAGTSERLEAWSARTGLSSVAPSARAAVDLTGRSWWATPCLVGTPGLEVATPRVAVTESGRAMAVWTENDGLDAWLWASEYTPTTGWSSARKVDLFRELPDDELRVRQPQVVADGEGRVLLMWLQSEGSTATQLWSARHVPGEGWSKADRVLAHPLGDATHLELARDAAGGFTVIWTQFDGDTFSENVWTTRGSPSTGWEPARRIDTPAPGFSLAPRVSVSSDGHVVVGWDRFDELEGIPVAWFSRWTPSEGWSAAERLSPPGVDGFYAEPVAGPGGTALALWSGLGAVEVELWARRFVPGSGWSTPERLEEVLGSSGAAQATAEREGRTLVVWPRARDGVTRLSSRPFDFTRGFRPREDVAPPPKGLVALDPRVVSVSAWESLAVWTQEVEGGRRIAASRYVLGRGWGPATWLDTETSAQTGFAHVAVGARGDAVATWLHGGEVPGVGLSVFQ
ncbi:hypothetical protein OWM54_25925 [Myxococcus sp. MISCRS1]|uniref:hypothetical protein n=1 Tax=Myxococcus sp. MISCRS1 TaxID=2996786 RepID=UPI002272165A|nr:hypothetical protein [Myxococcus sp. MISCRS1]MCY1000589.1 hypothetical protein [Myxococcus sp. MISCRS1]